CRRAGEAETFGPLRSPAWPRNHPVPAARQWPSRRGSTYEAGPGDGLDRPAQDREFPMFFQAPLDELVTQALEHPDLLRRRYAELFAEIERRDATLLSLCDADWGWIAGELDRIEALRVSGRKPGLFGLPVGVKDSIVVAGLPTKAGTQ